MSERFGYLTVVNTYKASNRPWDVRCTCLCDCGKEVTVLRSNLRAGRTKSCGCMASKLKSEGNKKRNVFRLDGNTAIGIATNTGNEFYVDAEDLPLIKDLSWHELSNGYIAHKQKNGSVQTLHRLIMGNPQGMVIDHIDHNVRDNRKNNLRVCSQAENMKNRKRQPKGITEITRGDRRYYVVQLHGYRGCFKKYEDAKSLRDQLIKDEYYIMED